MNHDVIHMKKVLQEDIQFIEQRACFPATLLTTLLRGAFLLCLI